MRPPETLTESSTAVAQGNRNQVIYWEDGHILREAEILPEPMRDSYIWLKTFAREECRKDMDLLVEKFRDHGVTVDRTNWTRILKGRWRLDTRNQECTPCISMQNFMDSIRALRDDVRIELLQGGIPFVETSVFNTIRRFVEKKMRPDRVNKFGLIIGPTGLQKTASYKELGVRDPFVKWMESAAKTDAELIVRMAVKFGATPNISSYVAKSRLFTNVTSKHCLIFDNTQNMVRDKKQLEKLQLEFYRQPAFEFLRALQDERGCTIILSITPENEEQLFSTKDESALIYNEQFEGRLGGMDNVLRLPNYSPKGDVVMIAEALGFKDAQKNGDRLFEISKRRGRIRPYFEILQEAKDTAEEDNERPTINHIEAVVLRLEEEAAKRSAKFKPTAK